MGFPVPKSDLIGLAVLLAVVFGSCATTGEDIEAWLARRQTLSLVAEFPFNGGRQELTIVREKSSLGARDPNRVFIANLTRDGIDYVTNSTECSALAEQMEAFRALPPLRVGPSSFLDPPNPMPIPSTTKDGPSWTIRSVAYAPDWSSVDVTIDFGDGPLIRWANETLRDLRDCWRPVDPPAE